jgi:hypothetical protein
MDDVLAIQQDACPPCENIVEFCVDIFIPAPFTFTNLHLEALDLSCLLCSLQQCEVTVEIPDPCGGTPILCPVNVIAVRALGCIKVFVDVIGSNLNTLDEVAFCGSTTVCVDNVICYQCLTDPHPCVSGFFNSTSISDVVVKETLTTACGNSIVSISGNINLPNC